MTNAKKIILTLSIPLVLSGCGGSNNGEFCGYDEFGDPIFCQVITPPTPPTPVVSGNTFMISQGLSNIYTQSYSYSLSSTDSYGNVFTLNYSSAPGPVSSFGAIQANTANVTETISENGQVINSFLKTNYFSLDPFQFLGSNAAGGGSYEVVNSTSTIAASGTVGQTFPYYTSTFYHDNTLNVVDASLAETLALAADTATTALLCQNDVMQLTQAGINDELTGGTFSNCFRIDPNGNIQGMQITTQVYNNSMLFF